MALRTETKFSDLETPVGSDEVVPLAWIRTASLVEGTTLLLLLFIAVPLKHIGDWPMAVQVMGPIHGLALSSYLCLVVSKLSAGSWGWRNIARLLLLPLLPFGGFLNAVSLARAETQAERFELGSGR